MYIYLSTGWHNIKQNPAILQISFYGDKGCWRSRKSMANTVVGSCLSLSVTTSSLVHVGVSFDVYYMLVYLFCKLITCDRISASLHVDCTLTHNTASINLSSLHCFHLFYCHFLFCAIKVMYISLMLTCFQIWTVILHKSYLLSHLVHSNILCLHMLYVYGLYVKQ